MNDDILPILRQLLVERGTQLLADYAQLSNLLADYAPAHRAERNLLILAAQERIPRDIADAVVTGQVIDDLAVVRWRKRLIEDHAIAEPSAAWVVHTWLATLHPSRSLAVMPSEIRQPKSSPVSKSGEQVLQSATTQERRTTADTVGRVAVRLDPTTAQVLSLRAASKRQQGDLKGALADLDRALSLDPNDPWVFNGQAHIYAEMRDFEAAEEAIKEAISLAPDEPSFLDSLADVRTAVGDIESAIAARQAVLNSPECSAELRADNEAKLARLRAEFLAPDLPKPPTPAVSPTGPARERLAEAELAAAGKAELAHVKAEKVALEASATGLKRGDLVEATILETSPTSVKVQLGEHGDGIVPGGELERMGRKALEALKPGMTLIVFVVNPHAREGGALVSINRAEEELDWQKAAAYKDSQQVYDTKIAGYNEGGLIVKFGRLRGFVPQSQINTERRRMDKTDTPESRWGKMINGPIVVKVMEVDRSRNRLILSERSAACESREKRKETLISQLTVGEVRTGRVVSIEEFGAFVDIGGAEGLIHITELSRKSVSDARQVLHTGQIVNVRVISIDRERRRVGLSIKQLESSP